MCVRPSIAFYSSFSLDMGRSPGFGPAHTDLSSCSGLVSLRLRAPPRLTLPACAARRTVLQKVRGHTLAMLPQLAGTGFEVLFHSPPGVLFTFPSQYSALSVVRGIQPCGVVPAPSHRVSRVPWYSGSCCRFDAFAYGALTLSGRPSQERSAGLSAGLMQSIPRHARMAVWAPPVSLAATPGITVVFFSSGYLDVSVHRVPSVMLSIHITVTEVSSAGFPHSDICGSTDICSSPQLFAAYRVFHRPLTPRHPPRAFLCLTLF